MHSYVEWVRWAFILPAAVVAIRLALRFWQFRGVWKIASNTTLNVASDTTTSPGVVVQSGPFRLNAKRTTTNIHLVAHSAADIPKEMLDALTPEQRKLVLDRLPGGAQGGASGSGSPGVKKP